MRTLSLIAAIMLTACYPGPHDEPRFEEPEWVEHCATDTEGASVYCRYASERWSWEDCGYAADGSDCDGWNDHYVCLWEVPQDAEGLDSHTEIIDWYVPLDGCPVIIDHWSD